MIPRATLRLQFHKGFTFADAEKIVPYMAELGVSHLYASPIMAARAGSMHGYDVIDPTRINPELGGEEGLKRLVEALRRYKLGLIVDIVPNHMAASLENSWWVDVLHHGEAGRYARSFDIDWAAEDPQLRGRVFLPLLGKPLHEAVASKELAVVDCEGKPALRYYDHYLPMTGPDIERQPYRLGWWRTANDRINWRRFFDINDLVCLRMEDPETFENVHALIARLYQEGLIDGVRIDHVDGLNDPAAYCRELRRRLDPDDPSRPYLVVEKILLKGETLPADWECDGTTGYDFMDQVSALQHDPAAESLLAEAWARISGRPRDFAIEEEAARRHIIAHSFAALLEATVAAFDRLAKMDPLASEISRPALRRALTEMLVHFPVYRSYATLTERPRRDRIYLDAAARNAKRTARPGDGWVIDTLHRWLSEPTPDITAIARFQQLSAPVAAKSVEDTAFYRYGRLLSRNDVGFDLDHFGSCPAEFHALMRARAERLPHSMLATATHDHKRGEDVRARLAVLSERPQAWIDRLTSWIRDSDALRTDAQPAVGDVAMLLQMVVGAWPFDLALEDERGRTAFAERLAAWQEKALREAKLRTNWADPNPTYETAAREFLVRLVADNAQPELLADIFGFIQSVAAAGAVNGLAQVVLKLTVPGVPDLYQGTDYWDLSLVDPDNRRPVDFEQRRKSLSSLDVAEVLDRWRDGRIKQAIVARLLGARRAAPELFARGDYRPVPVEGEKAQHIVAFLRSHGESRMLVVVPRLPQELLRHQDRLELDPATWQSTALVLPDEADWHDVIESGVRQVPKRRLRAQDLFGRLPVAIFSTKRS
jgi:malto-oligosyltrehalose synthase